MFKPAQIVITQGYPPSLASRIVRDFTGSWWTHNFLVLDDEYAIEAVFPRVSVFKIQPRIDELAQHNQDYVVMDLPGMTDEMRKQVVNSALTFKGQWYDILNCVYYAFYGLWANDGQRKMVCSRLVTAAFYDGLHMKIFDHVAEKLPTRLQYRAQNLMDGYCTPDELLRYSQLIELERTHLNMVF